MCLKCVAAAFFTFPPLVCVSEPTISKAKVYLCRRCFRCEAVFSKKVFVRARHTISAILPYGKNFNAVYAQKTLKTIFCSTPGSLKQHKT